MGASRAPCSSSPNALKPIQGTTFRCFFMDKKEVESYKKAGEITKEMQELSRKKLKVGLNLYELAEHIEHEIKKKGGAPAFPINLSMNNVAAHYTPSFESEDVV